jgi:hypothetical protein
MENETIKLKADIEKLTLYVDYLSKELDSTIKCIDELYYELNELKGSVGLKKLVRKVKINNIIK